MSFSADPTEFDQAVGQGGDEPHNNDNVESGSAGNDPHGLKATSRSCVTCRRRKVRCDKAHPCSNCVRAHIDCIFPAPGRAPRKFKMIRDGRDKELLERLRRLEGMVKGLGADGVSKETALPSNANNDRKSPSGNTPFHGSPPAQGDAAAPHVNGNGIRHKTAPVDRHFGRLVMNEDRSHYVNSSFWANLSNEVEDLKSILYQSSDDEGDNPTTSEPGGLASPSHQGWIFGLSSQNVDVLSLHPKVHQITAYWEVFKDRVDPLVKILHVPTFEQKLKTHMSQLSNLPKGFEALLFAMYYAVTTSLSESECLTQFGEEKTVLISRYTFGVQQSLARAQFLVTGELVVLQALVIWLMCLRRNDIGRIIWTLTGLVVRIAQTIGIHRDGTHFGLPPLEVELRRRLWWHICLLDVRSSEDHGCDPTIIESSFDTKMPLNVYDTDLHADMTEPPEERKGCTEMAFGLIRFEVADAQRHLSYTPPGTVPPSVAQQMSTLAEKEKWLAQCHERLEERYLRHCDMSVPLYWVTATVCRLVMSKMWLMVYHPFQKLDGYASLPAETREKLFITSLENVEYSILLQTEMRTQKWGWLFKTYMQWYALAFMLCELRHRTSGELCQRAWTAVEKIRNARRNTPAAATMDGRLWRPLRRVYDQAKEARQRRLAEEAATTSRGVTMPPIDRRYSPSANPMQDASLPSLGTRAPLSAAQLQRLSEGPAYGHIPIHKHEILRSRPSTESLSSTTSPEVRNADAARFALNCSSTPGFDLQGPTTIESLAGLSHDSAVMEGTMNTGDSRLPSDLLSGADTVLPNSQTQYNMPISSVFNMSGLTSADATFDPTGFETADLRMMDAPSDLDWQNWNQLVQQLGMEMEGSADMDVRGWTTGPGWELGGMTNPPSAYRGNMASDDANWPL